MDTNKDEEDIREEEITEVSPRRDTKTPSRITQKNHPEGLIVGNKALEYRQEYNYCIKHK